MTNKDATLTLPLRGLCAVTLWPKGIDPSALAVPGTPYQLVPRSSYESAEPFFFVEDQRLVALVTHQDDDDWIINCGGIVLGSSDLLSLRHGDVPFSIFHTVAGLELLSEVSNRLIVEQVSLRVTATLHGEPRRMRHGMTVLFAELNAKRRQERRRYLLDDVTEGESEPTLNVVPFQTVVVDHVRSAGSEPDEK